MRPERPEGLDGRVPPDPPDPPDPTVLIVDDEPDVVFPMQAVLEAEGLRTRLAGDGDAALRLLAAGRADAVVLDLMLPGLDGWVVLARLRDLPARPGVVVCSARSTPADRRRALDLGADAFVAKPYEPADLVAQVRRVLAPARSGGA